MTSSQETGENVFSKEKISNGGDKKSKEKG